MCSINNIQSFMFPLNNLKSTVPAPVSINRSIVPCWFIVWQKSRSFYTGLKITHPAAGTVICIDLPFRAATFNVECIWL